MLLRQLWGHESEPGCNKASRGLRNRHGTHHSHALTLIWQKRARTRGGPGSAVTAGNGRQVFVQLKEVSFFLSFFLDNKMKFTEAKTQ